MNFQEALAAFQADLPVLQQRGITFQPGAQPRAYLPDEFRHNFAMAMDAQPTLSTEANSAIPSWLTMYTSPETYKILFAPNKIAEIYKEQKIGDWTTQTANFPVVEWGGEVSSYDDYSENGSSTANVNFPQVQFYLFQIFKEFGELEVDRMALAKLNWVAEKDAAAAFIIKKFENLAYAYGIAGLQNWGALNDPNLSASLTPAVKANGGVSWFKNGTPNATPNEVYNDILALVEQLISQTNGVVNMDSRFVLALPPAATPALNFVNSFNVNTKTLLKDNFPSLRIVDPIQFGGLSSTNTQGNPAGNLLQLIAEETEGQKTGMTAFNEKMRAHRVILGSSSWRQKLTSGTGGAIIRSPMNVAQMVGI